MDAAKRSVFRWNGQEWVPVDGGVPGGAIQTVVEQPDGDVAIIGAFAIAGEHVSSNFARFACPPSSCYPNCDNSTQPPILSIADFSCFLQKFGSGDPYANCDQSTQPPILNIADFSCFLQKFAAGCP